MRSAYIPYLLITLMIAAFAAGCAKEGFSIGKGKPEEEMKQCVKLSMKNQYEDAIRCLEVFKSHYPRSQIGQEAELRIGDIYYSKKDYLLAAESYIAFLNLYPISPRGDYAHLRAGLSFLKESPKAIDRDQEYLDDAIKHLRNVLLRYSDSRYRGLASANLAIAQRRVARRHFYVGRFYYRTGEYIACIPRFMEVAEDYPDSGLADKALYMAVKANLGLDQIEGAKAAFGELSTKYPDSKYTKKAEHKLLRAVKRETKEKT